MNSILDFFLHLDSHLFTMIIDYGVWIYAILFAFIFIETGLVVMPFLPGDSLLFAAGTFCAGVVNDAGQTAELNLYIVLISLAVAAILGDSLNYYLGKTVGLKVLAWKVFGRTLVSEKHIDKTRSFYAKHGPKTIILARYVPVVRTFAPFVAGIGEMHFGKFIRYNVIGRISWVLLLVLVGYFFGNLDFVKNNFELVILGIVILSITPMIIEFIKSKTRKKE
ncbi:DedA family protein [Christiangramia flava]|uniref:DedA protein n=1 Tax=Christiangramia flava JLT2011 TaxID=1229726 RepID=A0A1L7I443_9FLAO|nr:DedA family protein [Christiangramia flava]APU68351.1 DedA protein [Christiangramia flava JLT2011]OSS40862.1 DedA protein [Christiangramia flava JLT2011]